MRMWMLPTLIMCGRHRSGEHNEIHKHIPGFRRGDKIDGRFDPFVAIELQSIESRHDELSVTLNHKSPLIDIPDLRSIYPNYWGKTVDMEYNLIDLYDRCPDCRNLIDSKPDVVYSILSC